MNAPTLLTLAMMALPALAGCAPATPPSKKGLLLTSADVTALDAGRRTLSSARVATEANLPRFTGTERLDPLFLALERSFGRADFVEATLSGFSGLAQAGDGDIEPLVYLVLMQAAVSAQEDLRAIIEAVQATSQARQDLRDSIQQMHDAEAALTAALRDAWARAGFDATGMTLQRDATSHRDFLLLPNRPLDLALDLTAGGAIAGTVACEPPPGSKEVALTVTVSDAAGGADVYLVGEGPGTVTFGDGQRGRVPPRSGRRVRIEYSATDTQPAACHAEIVHDRYMTPARALAQVEQAGLLAIRAGMKARLDDLLGRLKQYPCADQLLCPGGVLPPAASFPALRASVDLYNASALVDGGLRSFGDPRRELQDELDALSELAEAEALRLQQGMDRMSTALSPLAGEVKQASETAQAIVQLMK